MNLSKKLFFFSKKLYLIFFLLFYKLQMLLFYDAEAATKKVNQSRNQNLSSLAFLEHSF